MVAITVILAAVIGAFVLEIGDQQETAPSTSFDSAEEVRFIATESGSPDKVNTSYVAFTHAGGDVVEYSSLQTRVDGSPGVWDLKNPSESLVGTYPRVVPAPNILETLGTNEPVQLSSGSSVGAIMYGERPLDEYVSGDYYQLRTLPIATDGNWGGIEGVPRGFLSKQSTSQDNLCNKQLGSANREDETCYLLEEGQQITLTWEADSGGKTQTLFKYTVQQGNDAN